VTAKNDFPVPFVSTGEEASSRAILRARTFGVSNCPGGVFSFPRTILRPIAKEFSPREVMRILDTIPIQLDFKKVKRKLHLDTKTDYSTDVGKLVGTAEFLIEAKAVYEISYINQRGEDTVEVDGVTFTSRVLRVNLDKVERIFPFIITIGSALEDNASSCNDLLKQFYLETMGDMALGSSRQYLEEHLKRHFGLGQLSRMSPGSLKDWPVTEQKPLFSIFSNVEDLIGVTLTESMLMIPRKSVSGILFPTEVMFLSCQLCPRGNCPERKAPYDETLKEKYGLHDK